MKTDTMVELCDYQDYLSRYCNGYDTFSANRFASASGKQHCDSNLKWGKLDWDTSVLGVDTWQLNILRNTLHAENSKAIAAALGDISREGGRMVSCRIKLGAYETLSALESSGFKVVDVMNVFLWDGRCGNEIGPVLPEWLELSSELSGSDKEELVEIAMRSFSYGRISNDRHIDSMMAATFYKELSRSFICNTRGNQRFMLVAREGGRPVGFIAGELDEDLHSALGIKLYYLGMIALHPDARGKGLGRILLNHFLESMRKDSCLVEIATQTNNIAALNLYAGGGAKLASAIVTLHSWLE